MTVWADDWSASSSVVPAAWPVQATTGAPVWTARSMTSPGHRDHVLAHDTSLLECPVCRGDVRQRVHALHHGPQRARGDVAGDGTQHGGVGVCALERGVRQGPDTPDPA